MRHYLSAQEYQELRQWVFNTMSHVIPFYKTLISMLVGMSARCVFDQLWKYGQ